MSALGIDKSRTKVYGWVAGSFDFSTSATNNFPVSYDIFPNKIGLLTSFPRHCQSADSWVARGYACDG